MNESTGEPIGYIIGGGLKEGFNIRLTVRADTVQEGSFVVCDNGRFRYYGLVTDLQLGSTDPRFADEKSDRLQEAIQQKLLGKTLYTTLAMYPTLLMDRGPELGTTARHEWEQRVERGEESPGPRPVKTVPAHHADVRQADEADVAEIFGGTFIVGHTIEQGYPVRLDLARFIKRSSGIFGATGTGKSFLTRMVLAGLMQEDVAAALVFDMHNEYAFDDLDTYKFESGAVPLNLEPLQVLPWLTEAKTQFSLATEEVYITIEVEVEPGLPMIMGDKEHLARSLHNLVDNAIKFTPDGGHIRLWARCEPETDSTTVLIGVSDTGAGVPPEEQDKLFLKFQQLMSAKGRRKGTGLGLPYCKLVVELHGGRIWVESEGVAGKGSTFVMQLPVFEAEM